MKGKVGAVACCEFYGQFHVLPVRVVAQKPSNMFPLPCHFCSSSTVCPKGCSMLVMQDRMKATILSWTTCKGSLLLFLDTWAAEPTKPLYPETEYLLATLLESEKHESEVNAANSVTAVCKPKCSNTLAVKVLPPYQPAPQAQDCLCSVWLNEIDIDWWRKHWKQIWTNMNEYWCSQMATHAGYKYHHPPQCSWGAEIDIAVPGLQETHPTPTTPRLPAASHISIYLHISPYISTSLNSCSHSCHTCWSDLLAARLIQLRLGLLRDGRTLSNQT